MQINVKNGEYLQNSTFKINNNYSLDKSVDSSDKSLVLNSQLIAQKINFMIKEKPISLPNFSKGLASDETQRLSNSQEVVLIFD